MTLAQRGTCDSVEVMRLTFMALLIGVLASACSSSKDHPPSAGGPVVPPGVEVSDAGSGGEAGAADGGAFVPPTVLKDGQAAPQSLIAVGDTLYWANCCTGGASAMGEILSMPKAGGTVSHLGTSPGASFVRANATRVYWGTSQASVSQIMSAPLGGGAVPFASSLAKVSSLAVDATSVYVVSLPSISAVPAADGTPAHIADAPNGGEVIVDKSSLIFATIDNNAWTLATSDLTGASVTTVATNIRLSDYATQTLAADDSFVYWLTRKSITSTQLMKAPRAGGGAPIQAAEVNGFAVRSNLVIDAGSAYFTTTSGLFKVALATGAAVTLEGPSKYGTFAAVAVDDQYVYWSAGIPDTGDAQPTGAILRIPKM